MLNLSVFKVVPGAKLPELATPGSACFDLAACFHGPVRGFDKDSKALALEPVDGSVAVAPGSRILIPTGLIFQIPVGFEMRMSARSSVGLKNGLLLWNGIGVVDSDYVDEVFMGFVNVSSDSVRVTTGQRLCQARLLPVLKTEISEITERPVRLCRTGGFGSTGE